MRIIDYPACLGNFRTGRRGKVDLLILHTMEGGFGPTGVWFKTPDAKVSAHFGISVDGQIARYVLEHDTAFHAGNPDYNARSFGIEMEGHAADPDAFTPKLMESLLELCSGLCADWNIPRDRDHVLGHYAVPDPRGHGLGGAGHHTDPGKFFPWAKFMEDLRRRET